MMSFQDAPAGHERRSPAEQTALLAHRFAGVGWEVPRIFAALPRVEDFYFENVGIELPDYRFGNHAPSTTT